MSSLRNHIPAGTCKSYACCARIQRRTDVHNGIQIPDSLVLNDLCIRELPHHFHKYFDTQQEYRDHDMCNSNAHMDQVAYCHGVGSAVLSVRSERPPSLVQTLQQEKEVVIDPHDSGLGFRSIMILE